jgi:hypothetical protein
MEQVFYTTSEKRCKHKKSQDISKSVRTLNEQWLFDTGATFHVMLNKHLLFNTSIICCREIKVANGRHVQARLVGNLFLKSECGNYLYLQGVLFSPSLTRISPVHPRLSLHDYYEKRLRTNAVQGFWTEDESQDYEEFIYIYWPATAGTCSKIPGANNYEQ